MQVKIELDDNQYCWDKSRGFKCPLLVLADENDVRLDYRYFCHGLKTWLIIANDFVSEIKRPKECIDKHGE